MQDLASRLLRIPLLRTPVNRATRRVEVATPRPLCCYSLTSLRGSVNKAASLASANAKGKGRAGFLHREPDPCSCPYSRTSWKRNSPKFALKLSEKGF